MFDNLDTLALIGIFILVGINTLLNQLKERGIDLRKMATQISDMHKWHSVTDDEGVKVWYVRKSLEKAITDLSSNVKEQTDVGRKQTSVLQAIHSEQLHNAEEHKAIIEMIKESGE